MDFERREYEYVRKIAETGSFLAAADKLYITQPSLSQFIRRIEAISEPNSLTVPISP